jgi:hypothetical protein
MGNTFLIQVKSPDHTVLHDIACPILILVRDSGYNNDIIRRFYQSLLIGFVRRSAGKQKQKKKQRTMKPVIFS